MLCFKEVMEYFGYIANIAAVIGIPYGAWQIYEARKEYKKNQEDLKKEEARKNTPISIHLKEKDGNKTIILPNTIRRGELTRAEVLGRLGMIPMLPDPKNPQIKQRRFEIKKNATEEFMALFYLPWSVTYCLKRK